jgi:hypothetical protein
MFSFMITAMILKHWHWDIMQITQNLHLARVVCYTSMCDQISLNNCVQIFSLSIYHYKWRKANRGLDWGNQAMFQWSELLMWNKVGKEVFSERVNINTDPQGSSHEFAVKPTCCRTSEERQFTYLYFISFVKFE